MGTQDEMVSRHGAGRRPCWHHIQGKRCTSAACLARPALPRHCLTSPQGCFLCWSSEELQSWQPQMTPHRNISLQKLGSRPQARGREKEPRSSSRKQTKPHFCDNVTERKVKVTIRASRTSQNAVDSLRWKSHPSGAPVGSRWPCWVELGPGRSWGSRASLREQAGKMMGQLLLFQRFNF